MGYLVALPILALCVILQNSWLTDFRLLDGQPELVLMAVLAWAWHAEQNEAIFWAFVGGILQDVLNPIVPTGTTVIAMLVMVFVIRVFKRNFYQVNNFKLFSFEAIGVLINSIILAVVLTGIVVLGALLNHVILLLVISTQGLNLPLADYFLHYSIPCIAFDLLLTFPIYFVLRRIQKRLPRRQSPWEVNVSR